MKLWILGAALAGEAHEPAPACAEALTEAMYQEAYTEEAEAAVRAAHSEAADLYDQAIAACPLTPRLEEVRAYQADALHHAGRLREALALTEDLLQSAHGERWELALYRRFYLRYLILEEEYGGSHEPAPGAPVERIVQLPEGQREWLALSEDHLAFIEAADAVREYDFRSPVIAEVRDANLDALHYLPGELLFYHHRYEEARPRLEALIEAHPESADAYRAASLIVNTYVADGDLDAVVRESARLRDVGPEPVFMQGVYVDDLESWQEAASFKQALRVAQDGDHLGAAEGFLAWAEAYPHSDHRPLALYNAGNSYLHAGKETLAMEAFARYVADYPKGNLAPMIYWRLAVFQREQGDREQAIDYWTELFRLFPEDPNAPGAVYYAGLLHAELGEAEQAATHYEYVYHRWPELPDAEATRWMAGPFWRAVGEDEARSFYLRYLRDVGEDELDHALQAHYWLAQLGPEAALHEARVQEIWSLAQETGVPLSETAQQMAAGAPPRRLPEELPREIRRALEGR